MKATSAKDASFSVGLSNFKPIGIVGAVAESSTAPVVLSEYALNGTTVNMSAYNTGAAQDATYVIDVLYIRTGGFTW